MWDVKTERELATLRGHKNTINALTFAPEGTSRYSGCLASGSADGTIRFWDPNNGQELAIFTTGHTEWVKAVAFTEDGTILASAAFNGTVEVWNLKTRQELMTFTKAESGWTEAVAFSLDATHFISRGRSGTIVFNPYGRGHRGGHFQQGSKVQFWKIVTGEELLGPWQEGTDFRDPFVFSPDNKVLATRGPRDVRAWDLNTGVQIFWFNTITPFPKKLKFSPNGTLLAIYGIHGTPQVWDVKAGREFPTLTTERAWSFAFSTDDTTLALGHKNSTTLWDVTATGIQERSVIPDNRFSEILTFSPDGKTLLSSKWDGLSQIQLWNVNTGRSLGILFGHTESIETLVFSHDGKTLASGSEDGTVLLWDWEKIIAERVADNK